MGSGRERGDRATGTDGERADPDRPSAPSPVARLKRALFLGLLPLLSVVTFVTGLLGAPGSFDRLVLPVVSLLLLALLLSVYGRWVPPRFTESALFVLFSLVYLGKLTVSLAPGRSLDQIFVWTPLLYVLAFMLFEPVPALLSSVTVVLASGGLTAARAPLTTASPRSLIEFFLATSVLIVMVYALSRLRIDVATLQAQLAGMRELAHQDPLTALPNRRALEATLIGASSLAERRAQRLAVLLFDLDGFKRVNDQHGHIVGDAVLRGVAARGGTVLRRSDTLGRWGGEEFLVVAPGIDLPGGLRLAERLRDALRSQPIVSGVSVTASFGVTSYHPGDSPDRLVERADDALYLAKQGGKDRVEALTREMVEYVALPKLATPFRPVERNVDALQRGTLEWLKAFRVAPAEVLYRWVDGVQPGWLAGHIHRPHRPEALQLVSDWTFWMFLHDDHCDTSRAGSHPRHLIDLHQRLLAVLAGQPADPADGPLGALFADLRRRLEALAGEEHLARFTNATDRYFAATRWEAANRASRVTPDPDTYERMRLLTSGLQIDSVLLEALDGVPRSDHPLAEELRTSADRAVCWANDIYSLNKEVKDEDVHNLVLALQAAHGLGLTAALSRAASMHDEQVARFQRARASVAGLEAREADPLRRIAAALEARIGANVSWSLRCSRYLAETTVRVRPDEAAGPRWAPS